jgi:uroporphyrinogen III methyltransferase/synthase
MANHVTPGTVYLVGAGPGDPGLVTVRGAEILGACDAVVYDRLAPAELLALAPPHAERFDVGKRPRHLQGAPREGGDSSGDSRAEQEEINELLVSQARLGRVVVRLKGGDPFVFGRGGEEAYALAMAGIPFEVVPGVSAAVAVPAYAGIPVTNRGLSESVTVVTGHGEDGGPGVDWERLGLLSGTLVVLMGVTHRAEIVKGLIAGGRDPSTPVAIVRWGTRPDQVTVRTTLERLPEVEVRPPATIVVGEVAGLNLAWYESRPLFGWKVVVTRARERASELSSILRAKGAGVVELPVIQYAPPPDGGAALERALGRLEEFGWVVFTSAQGVRALFGALAEAGGDARRLGGVRVAAIGPGTATALREKGIVADLVPETFVAESLLEAFPEPTDPAPPSGPGWSQSRFSVSSGERQWSRRVLIARAAVARDVLPEGLAAKGYQVEVVPAYSTVRPQVDPATAELAKRSQAVAFTSSSTVEGFVELLGRDAVPPVVACIGPVTAATARSLGIEPAVVASEHSVPGLVDALVEVASRTRP